MTCCRSPVLSQVGTAHWSRRHQQWTQRLPQVRHRRRRQGWQRQGKPTTHAPCSLRQRCTCFASILAFGWVGFISVVAQLTLALGQDIFARKCMYEKLSKCAVKILVTTLTIPKFSDFAYINCPNIRPTWCLPEEYFFSQIWRATIPPWPPSPTPVVGLGWVLTRFSGADCWRERVAFYCHLSHCPSLPVNVIIVTVSPAPVVKTYSQSHTDNSRGYGVICSAYY